MLGFGRLLGCLQDPHPLDLVSTDIIGSPVSCIFESKLTTANGNLVKVLGWYDNKTGRSSRLVDLATLASAPGEQ